MAMRNVNPAGITELANNLIRQRTFLREYDERRSGLQARVTDRERQYAIKSEHVHDAIRSGRLKESQEVCDWIMDYELLQRSGR